MVVDIQVPKFGNIYLFIGKWLAHPTPVPRVRGSIPDVSKNF